MMTLELSPYLALLGFWGVVHGDIVGTDPPTGSCLCFSTNNVNIRDTACGSVIGVGNVDDCFTYRGSKHACNLGGTNYEFFNLNYFNQDGWIAGNYLDLSDSSLCDTTGGNPAKEFRSVWVATVSNIDWPISAGSGTLVQQSGLMDIFNKMTELKMNVLIFQVRPAGDAFYDSSLEPWSRWLTGTQGQAPDPLWDPLGFAITEAHKRNIEIHAWLNPYRANTAPTFSGLAPSHMANRYPQYAYQYGNYLWMDPGAKVIQDHLSNVINDVITRYDVDGIHFDDYFYPYPVSGVEFPDDQTYADYLASGGTLGRADWRRDNVNTMVRRAHDEIKNVRRTIKFGIAPFGIYRPGHPEGMPSPIAGLDQYEAIYADPKLWLQSGWLDYIAPQLYWQIGPPAQSYPTLLSWWLNVNTQKRHVYGGNAVYKMDDLNHNWPVSEIVDQVQITRTQQSRLALGNIFFSYKWFRRNYKGITDTFKKTIYSTPATVPKMPWLSGQTVAAPRRVQIVGDLVTWESEGAYDGDLKWVIYRRDGSTWQVASIVQFEVSRVRLTNGVYMIRGRDRAGNEGGCHVIHIPYKKMSFG